MSRIQNVEKYREATQFKSGQQAVESGRRGGIASGVAKRKKKACAEIAMRVINSELSPADKAKVEKITGELGEDENTLYAAAFAQMVARAIKGDPKAFREVQNVIEKAQGNTMSDRKEDALSAALKEMGESL